MLYRTEQVKPKMLPGFTKRAIRITEKIAHIDAYRAEGIKNSDQVLAALKAAPNGLSVLCIFSTPPNNPQTR